MKVTHLQNVRQIFHEKTHNLCNEFVASYFFLEGFLEYEILKKKTVSVRRCLDSSYLFTPLGASLTQVTRNVIMTSLVSKACQKNGGHFTERTTTCEIFVCAATRWINDIRMATISSSMFFLHLKL